MPLHDRDAIGDRLEECCVFAGHSLSLPVPKYRFPADQMAPKAAFQMISDELILDGNARQNLATFCQTWAEPELLALMELSFNRFAKYWDIEMREIPMAPGRYAMDPAAMLERVDENTIMVVPTFGVTYTGAYEPVAELAAALDQLQADTGLDIDIHVDGASGAFLAPFCAPDVVFDFRLPRVKSISTSGHKFGLAPLGVGWVIWRDAGELPEDLVFHVNYLGGDMPDFQINFSRPAGQIVAQYYNFLRLGRDGYERIHQASYDTGQYIAREIVKLGPFELLCDSRPETGIPTVTWRIKDGADPGYTLFDLADRLRARGWQVPAYTLTGTASGIAVQRVLVRLGVSRDMASLLLDDRTGGLVITGRGGQLIMGLGRDGPVTSRSGGFVVSVPDAEPLPILEALHSTPARRYLSAEPVPEEVIWAILDAAVRGPSGGNQQGWGWVVVTDPAVKAPIAAWYLEGWNAAYGNRREEILAAPAGSARLSPASFLAAEHLAQHLAEAPVWVFPVLRQAATSTSPRLGSSIYGAVQQLMLAARAYGVGATLTTLYAGHEDEVRELLGLPDDALTMALIPLGYPTRGRWKEPSRRPLPEVVHWDRWGTRRERG